MGDERGKLHHFILCMLHDLAFGGGCGLHGDINERLLRSWYETHYESYVNSELEKLIKATVRPPERIGKE